MSLSTKRALEVFMYFVIGLAVIYFSHTAFYVYAGIVTGINILYIVMALTILPTLKKTVPNFFGGFVSLNFGQVLHCMMLCVASWAPVAILIGGK